MIVRRTLSSCLALSLLSFLTACGGNAAPSLAGNGNSIAVPSSSPDSAPAPSVSPTAPPPSTPTPSTPPVATQIQNESGWQWCTAQLNGHECASGKGNATSSQVTNLGIPSLSGASAKFSLGGKTPYSNALWWKEFGGHDSAAHFTYDVNFYIDNASAPEALEFDVNQSFGGNKYIFGTQCSYKDSGKWDIWNDQTGRWESSKVPCPEVSSNQWHHLVWQFERKGNQVHYISVTLDGKTSNVDLLRTYKAGLGGDDLSVALQLDGDFKQTPFNVWLDNVTLTAW